MTLAIALINHRRTFAFTLTLPPVGDTWPALILLAMLTGILAGLCLDLAAGWPVGTVTMFPASLAAGAAVGLLLLELGERGHHGPPDHNRL
ncbi:MAG: hypothetical protein KDJ52_00080 [Anaerolineae bacterium]|nr:hypothetical protein [Anaerolineae bacterium]